MGTSAYFISKEQEKYSRLTPEHAQSHNMATSRDHARNQHAEKKQDKMHTHFILDNEV